MKLWHGTTRARAEQIIRNGPSAAFVEPGGRAKVDGFSMSVADGPFHFGSPVDGGPMIVEVDVPEEVVRRASTGWFPISQGLIQFDPGAGFEVLAEAWPQLEKRLITVEGHDS